MKVVVDTNVLVRAAVRDDPVQTEIAVKVLTSAELIVLVLSCLCEFVWVVRKVYDFHPAAIENAIRALLAAPNVEVNKPAVEAGLLMLAAGGNFADGVIAYEGYWNGGETFVSFDKKAAALLKDQGRSVQLLQSH